MASSVEVFVSGDRDAPLVFQLALSDRCVIDQKLKEETKRQVTEQFELLRVTVCQKLFLNEADEATFRMQVNLETQVATWWFDWGPDALHEVFLGYSDNSKMDALLYGYMNRIEALMGPETGRAGRSLPKLQSGMQGHVGAPHALQSIPMPREKMPSTLSGYANQQLLKAMRGHVTPNEVKLKMQQLATVHLYRKEMVTFLHDKITQCSQEVQRLQTTSANMREIRTQERLLQQLQGKLTLFENADMYAVQTAIVHATDENTVQAAVERAEATVHDLTEVAELDMKAWYNPRGPKHTGLSPDQRRYAARVGAMQITDPLVHHRYCAIYGLDHSEHMAVEQGVLLPLGSGGGHGIVDLFADIQDQTFQMNLTAVHDQAMQEIDTLQQAMQHVAQTTPQEVVKACVKLYEEAAV